MIQTVLASFFTASILSLSTVSAMPVQAPSEPIEIGSASMSLDNRYGYDEPGNAYKDNILLNIAYLSGEVKSKQDIDWDVVRQPFTLKFSLQPGERFAYHDVILPEYQDRVVLAGHTNFGAAQGYKYADGLYGMGVCHFASLIHKAALTAGLQSVAPSNHDFYAIPEISREYGVAIFNSPNAPAASAKQNLYIKNNFDTKVDFRFDYDGDNLKVSVLKH